MPEGDTIRRLAERINTRFAGQRVQRCVTRDPRLVGVDLAGAVLLEADASGKHLLVRFDDGRTLHAHLRMDGSFRVGPAATEPAWRRRDRAVAGRRAADRTRRSRARHRADGRRGPHRRPPRPRPVRRRAARPRRGPRPARRAADRATGRRPPRPAQRRRLRQRVRRRAAVRRRRLPEPAGRVDRRPGRVARPRRRGHPHERGAWPAEHDRPPPQRSTTTGSTAGGADRARCAARRSTAGTSAPARGDG